MAKRKRNLNPNRFQKQDDKGLFSFDEIRKDLFKWGLVAGGTGGVFFIQSGFIWQIVGFLAIFFITSRQIEKAARRVPRWHAVFYCLIGTMAAMFVVIIIGNLILVYLFGGVPAS